jgi:hypothetical protein
LENCLLGQEPGFETDSYSIAVSEMTEEEFSNLPEIDGF